MKMLYRQAELAEERSIILNAIGYANDPNILSQVRILARDERRNRLKDPLHLHQHGLVRL
jgi:hypothetical protein